METIAIVGQAIIGIVYLLGTINDIMQRDMLLQMLRSKSYLRYEEYLLYGAIGLKIVCSLMLIFNWLAPVGAFFLAGFTMIANCIFHPFWASGPAERKREYFAFITQAAIIGGLLVVVGR